MDSRCLLITDYCLLITGSAMLSPQERHIIIGSMMVLVLGATVKACRSRVEVEQGPKVNLPSVQAAPAKPDPGVD
jgi:hypothetical protein